MPHTPFSGAIPDDLLYDPHYDMWVRECSDGTLQIGATSFGIFLAGEILAFTAKPKGAEVRKGRGMGTVECRKTVLAVHAPVSLIVLEGNENAEERPRCLNEDSYHAGWMVRAQPTDWGSERNTLLDAPAYRAHILRLEPEARFVS